MIRVIVCTAYPAGVDLDPDAIEFALWPGYGCRNAHEAHNWLLELLTAASEVLGVLDETEELWSFYPDTVGAIITYTT